MSFARGPGARNPGTCGPGACGSGTWNPGIGGCHACACAWVPVPVVPSCACGARARGTGLAWAASRLLGVLARRRRLSPAASPTPSPAVPKTISAPPASTAVFPRFGRRATCRRRATRRPRRRRGSWRGIPRQWADVDPAGASRAAAGSSPGRSCWHSQQVAVRSKTALVQVEDLCKPVTSTERLSCNVKERLGGPAGGRRNDEVLHRCG